MKIKTIKKIIEDKVDDWLYHMKTEMNANPLLVERFGKDFITEVKKDVIVTGGCIVSMLLQEEPNDYDIYFKTKETAKKVAEFYVKNNGSVTETENGVTVFIKSSGLIKESKKRGEKYGVASITDNAISLHNDIQLIMRFTGDPDEIHKNFDFIHTKNYWHNGNLVLNPKALESIITKELRYDGSLFPVCSIFRTIKFVKRGWKINMGEMLKMIYDANKLNLEDITVLREQLIGVDALYFITLIEKLNEGDFDDFRSYLFDLIDEIFNDESSD